MCGSWSRASFQVADRLTVRLVPPSLPTRSPNLRIHLLQCCQADPLGEVEAWRGAILGSLPAVRPTSPPPLQHVSSLIVQVYVHRLRSLPLQGPDEPG